MDLWDWVFLAFALVGVYVMLYAVFFNPYAPKRPKAIENVEPEKLILIEPYDEFDMFCSCPTCYWLGNHAVEVKPYKKALAVRYESMDKPTHYNPVDGHEVVVGTWQNPRIRTVMDDMWHRAGWTAHRTCIRCGNTWTTPANAPEGEVVNGQEKEPEGCTGGPSAD